MPGHPDYDGRLNFGDNDTNGNGPGYNLINYTGGGAYYMRFSWDVVTQLAQLDVDLGYAGGEFISDVSVTANGEDNGFNAYNNYFFFGGENGITYTNLEIVPEPSALSLLAVGLGGLAMIRRRRS
ncbi:MAG: PEP-CTERM sorting domain-containing protein [Chitinophagia bacterium]|nr:PEP-CTERM sorting domain-containing protein [Chitinophagia bacterium]